MCDPFNNLSIILAVKLNTPHVRNITEEKNSSSVIRIGAIYDYPYATNCFVEYPKRCSNPGLEIEFIYTVIHDMLKYTVKLMYLPTYTEAEKAMDRKELDLIGTTMSLEPRYIEKWSYTPVTTFDGLGFLVKLNQKPDSFNVDTFILLRTFKFELWLTLAAVTLSTVLLNCFWKVFSKSNEKQGLRCWHTLTAHGGSTCMVTFWFVMLSVILNFFGNLITVQLLLKNDAPEYQFKSIAELGRLVVSHKCSLVLLKKYNDEAMFSSYLINPTHNKSWARDFRRAYRTNPPRYVDERDEIVKAVLSNDCTVGVDYLTLEHYYKKRFCDLSMLTFEDDLTISKFVYFHNFDEQMTEALNQIITSNPMVSYSSFLIDKYYFAFEPNCEKGKLSIEKEPLTIDKIKDSFFVLLFGLIVSVFIHIGKYLKMWLQSGFYGIKKLK